MPGVLWILILLFSTAECCRRLPAARSFFASFMINLVLYGVCSAIWMLAESDGIAQMAGVMIYTVVFGALLLVSGGVHILIYRYRKNINH